MKRLISLLCCLTVVEIPADPFAKPAFPIVIKQDLMEVKVPKETEQFEDLSADRTPLALELADSPSPNELDNHEDKRSKSSLVTEHCEDGTPTPATKSSADSGWRSPHRDLLPMDPDIENIELLESPELDSQQLPLISMLDCHGIHMDKKDLISPSLRLIS